MKKIKKKKISRDVVFEIWLVFIKYLKRFEDGTYGKSNFQRYLDLLVKERLIYDNEDLLMVMKLCKGIIDFPFPWL